MQTIAHDQQAYLRHAQRFGVECVLETFARQYLPGPKVVYGGDPFAYDLAAETPERGRA